MRPDYYTFNDFTSSYPYAHAYRTLRSAKKAYLTALQDGHRLSCTIAGMTNKDESIHLTYTPFYEDDRTFGRTEITYIGKAIKNGTYKL